MGLVKTLLTFPVSGPVKGGLWVAGKIHEAAEQKMNDPAAIRSALQRLEDQLLSGEISEDEYDEAEEVLLRRLQASGA